MEKQEPHINILPQLNRSSQKLHKQEQIDPDVENILKKQNDIDIFGSSQPTKEENINDTTKENSSSSSESRTWLIIILAVIVVILIIVIVWYVLRETEETVNHPQTVPLNVIKPGGKQHNITPAQYNQMMGSHPIQNITHPSHPYNRPQVEQLQPQSQMANIPKVQKEQPTKDDLLSTLNQLKLKPIPEEPLKEEESVKKVNTSEQKIQQVNDEQENAGKDDNDEQDQAIANKFYNNLQKNIEDEDEND